MIVPPWKNGNRSAYHKVTDLSTLALDAKRRRNTLDFIATDEALAATPTACAKCGEPVLGETDGRGNRGEYFPKTKTYVVRHYYCAWDVVLGPGGELEKLLNRRDKLG